MRVAHARTRTWLPGLVGAVVCVGLASPLLAQDGENSIVQFPQGVPVALLPIQSVQPLPSGAWPGGARSLDDALKDVDAELAFAFGYRRAADDWAMPSDIVSRAARNPSLHVEPRQLAYRGLIKPAKSFQLYEPLQSQLRAIGALFNTRYCVVPVSLWYESLPADTAGGRAAAATTSPDSGSAGTERGRAVMLLAVVDVRRSVIIWHGRVEGDPAPPGSSALVASLAERLANQLAPS